MYGIVRVSTEAADGTNTTGGDTRQGLRLRAAPAARRPATDGAPRYRTRSASGRSRRPASTSSSLSTRDGLVAERHKSRGYRLPRAGRGPDTVLTPLLGRVPAGALEEAIEDPDGYIPVQGHGAADDLFALRGRGESMTGAGILPGDLVIVRRQPTARSGEIVVALVDREATVKTLRLRGRRVELRAENPAFEPIVLDADTVSILGKVIEVRRILKS